MKCEYCNKDHDGSYGSGRFCSSYCAHGFTTRDKRQEINDKVREQLRKQINHPFRLHSFKKGYDPNRYTGTSESMKIASQKRHELRKISYLSLSWNELPIAEKKRRILEEQNIACVCGIKDWNNKKLTLELHHRDGNTENNSRDNLEMLCPNCHSQTDTFRNRKRECIPIEEEIVSKTIK